MLRYKTKLDLVLSPCMTSGQEIAAGLFYVHNMYTELWLYKILRNLPPPPHYYYYYYYFEFVFSRRICQRSLQVRLGLPVIFQIEPSGIAAAGTYRHHSSHPTNQWQNSEGIFSDVALSVAILDCFQIPKDAKFTGNKTYRPVVDTNHHINSF